MNTVVWVDDLHDGESAAVGSKMARLGTLRRAGVKVPDGFAVTTGAYRRFCCAHAIDVVVARALAKITDAGDTDGLERASAHIRAAVEAAPVPEDIAGDVVDAYEELCYRRMDLNIPVAVRSSATGEDAADASFAGQFDTYLGISGPDALLDALRRCWASLFTARALGYRLTKGLDHSACPMAVGVIELVHARASGVAFSVHPVTGRGDRIVLEGSWGWGEAVVQGLVVPDHIEVGKTDGRILDYAVGEKKVVSAFDYARGLVVERDMPTRLVNARVLDDEQVGAVVDAVCAIERHYGHPVDVEWVVDRHRRPGEPVSIVQTRPVTVTVEAAAAPPTWDPVAYANKYVFSNKERER